MTSIIDRILTGSINDFPLTETTSVNDWHDLLSSVNTIVTHMKQLSLHTLVFVTQKGSISTDEKRNDFCNAILKVNDKLLDKHNTFVMKINLMIYFVESFTSGQGNGGCYDGYHAEFAPMQKALKECLTIVENTTDFYFKCQEFASRFADKFDISRLQN